MIVHRVQAGSEEKNKEVKVMNEKKILIVSVKLEIKV